MASWKLTLVMLCVLPFILFFTCFVMATFRKGFGLARRTWEKAGGIAEEMLYNIKTVASFANFDYELNKFNKQVDEVYNLELINSVKLAFVVGLLVFFSNICIFIAFIYGRTLIRKDYNTNKGRDFKAGDVISAAFCTLMGISGLRALTPNLKVIIESCSAFLIILIYMKENQRWI